MSKEIAVYDDTSVENGVLLEQADGTLAPTLGLYYVKRLAYYCEKSCRANEYAFLTPEEVGDSKGPQLGYLQGGEYHAL